MLAAAPLVTGATECEQSTPAPVCGLECGAGEQIVCGNACATVGALNDDCDPDPCSEKGLCENGLACQYTAFGYLCRPAETLWQTCSDPGGGPDDDECANNLFCRENDACPDYPYGFPAASCFPPVTQEGFQCDSDFDDPECFPCAPGLECTTVGSESVCLRPCSDDYDCACEGGDPVDCFAGLCRECVEAGDKCDAYFQCCDESSCRGQNEDGTSFCCLGPDEDLECSSTSECCPGAVCAQTGPNEPNTCLTCKNCGEECGTSAACCGGAACVEGRCTECVPNAPCNSGEPGVCAEGTTQCANGCFEGCEPGDVFDPDECDGLDGDCDGVPDEQDPSVAGVGEACDGETFFNILNETEEVSCHSGFEPPGNEACLSSSGLECVALVCSACESGSICGNCLGQACDSTSLCMPELKCINYECVAVTACDLPPNACWLPEDVGTCL